MLSDEFITEAARRIVRDPSTGTLTELLERAFDAGRESAYTTDEWRVVVPEPVRPAIWCRSFSEEIGRHDLDLAQRENPDAWLEHRRTGATDWGRVDV